jgi:uridine phosphorylase
MQNYIFMNIIQNTELILNEENKIYHLNLSKEQIANDILLVGDPKRVEMISNKFDTVEYKVANREFITHTGYINRNRISVISTGIGADNIDIVINELDALVNIDFDKRIINKKKRSLNIIRLGTSGSLQKHIPVDSIIISSYSLGFDGLAHFYKNNNIIEKEIFEKYQKHTSWPDNIAEPYFIKASDNLLNKFHDMQQGITATASGFYGPQGRTLRLKPSIDNLHDKLSNFNFNGSKIMNFEMECSALYYLGRSLGHNTLTICAVLGNRITKTYSKDYYKIMNKMINLTIERLF